METRASIIRSIIRIGPTPLSQERGIVHDEEFETRGGLASQSRARRVENDLSCQMIVKTPGKRTFRAECTHAPASSRSKV